MPWKAGISRICRATLGVADREADPLRLVVERGAPDQLLQHHLVDAEGAGLLDGELLAGLLGELSYPCCIAWA